MKRMFVFFIVVIAVCLCFCFKTDSAGLCSLNGEYSVYLKNNVVNIPQCFSSISNGQGVIVTGSSTNYNLLNFNKDIVSGESIKLTNYSYKEVCEILKFKELMKYEFSDGLSTFYGQVPFGDKSVFVSGKRINCQIAVCNDYIVVGIPIILGSY